VEGRTYRSYLLVVLITIAVLSSVDRTGFSMAVQSVKADLRLSDTEIGALTGIVFAIFYAIFGVPIGRLADNSDRVAVTSVCLAVGAAAVTGCGLVTSFISMAATRVVVAAGEAGAIPTAYSLISDQFSREERPAALGLYFTGGTISQLLGFILGGWLTQHYGWRLMFVAMGAPGMVFAPIVYLTLRDRRENKEGRSNHREGVTIRNAVWPARSRAEVTGTAWKDLARLGKIRTFRSALIALCGNYLFAYALLGWDPAFFMRTYGLSASVVGLWLAIGIGGAQLVGSSLGGWLAGRFARNNEQLQLAGVAITYGVFGASQACAYWGESYQLAFSLIGVGMMISSLSNGPLFAALQGVVPERMRALSMAVIMLFANLIGMGLGPLAVGILSDALRPEFGELSLRYALLLVCPGFCWGVWFMWKAARTVGGDTVNEDGNPSGDLAERARWARDSSG